LARILLRNPHERSTVGSGAARRPRHNAYWSLTRMKPHRALLIVDVQRAFSPPAPFVAKLHRYSRHFSCRIFTRYTNPASSLARKVLKQKCCAPGSPDIELLIKPNPGDVVLNKPARYGLSPSQVRQFKRRGINVSPFAVWIRTPAFWASCFPSLTPASNAISKRKCAGVHPACINRLWLSPANNFPNPARCGARADRS